MANKNFLEDLLSDSYVKKAFLALLVILSVFLLVQTLFSLKEFSNLNNDVYEGNTISVEGEATVSAVPDIAKVSFSVSKEEKTQAEAQSAIGDISDAAIKYLKDQGVDEKDIKTTNHSVYPKYDYIRQVCPDLGPCEPGKQELRGYQASQSMTVTIRDMENVGTILGGLGEIGVTNINGPSLEIEDQDALKEKARSEAIKEAKGKAKVLAGDLGVRLGRVVNFYESGNGGYPYPVMYDKAMMGMETVSSDSSYAPEIPTGENEITVHVTVIYKIK